MRKGLTFILVSCLCLPQAFGEATKHPFSPTDLTKNIKGIFGYTFGDPLTTRQKQDAGCGELIDEFFEVIGIRVDIGGYNCESDSAPKPFTAFDTYIIDLNRKSILGSVLATGKVADRKSCVVHATTILDAYKSKYGNVFTLVQDDDSTIMWQDKHSSAKQYPLPYRTIYFGCDSSSGNWQISLSLGENEFGHNPETKTDSADSF
jgi:hypothetical protein